MTPGVCPVCIFHRQFGCRHSLSLLLTNTCPSLAPKQNLFSSENTAISTPSSNDLRLGTTGVANGNGLESWNTRCRALGLELALK
ncbi:hypothetical protein TNCV_2455521 [Trichonephila clavipes]|nr:hypothetical protein TNCV_2455521 [Trichonephila clavipes]